MHSRQPHVLVTLYLAGETAERVVLSGCWSGRIKKGHFISVIM